MKTKLTAMVALVVILATLQSAMAYRRVLNGFNLHDIQLTIDSEPLSPARWDKEICVEFRPQDATLNYNARYLISSDSSEKVTLPVVNIPATSTHAPWMLVIYNRKTQEVEHDTFGQMQELTMRNDLIVYDDEEVTITPAPDILARRLFPAEMHELKIRIKDVKHL